MSFNPERLLNMLLTYPQPSGYLLGFSGGLDSHALLHALAALGERLPAPLRAIHVDHGLQSQAVAWSRHCASVCAKLNVPLETFSLQLQPVRGESLEALAREARYGVLARELRTGEMLLTAHHQDDQAETLLLQLLRGAGLSGLAAMPGLTEFSRGWHTRPLLAVSRDELMRYAGGAGLEWIEDTSNRDIGFDRNYLRHAVIPLLKARWPALGSTLSRSARHCAEADGLIETLLSRTLERIHQPVDGTLSVAALNALPAEQQSALLRLWFGQRGVPSPTSAILQRIISEVLGARRDATPQVAWSGAEVRRYRDRLYLMPPLAPFDPSLSLVWRGEPALALPAGLGTLHFRPSVEETGERAGTGRYRIRFRRGGEQCRPLGRGVGKRVKALLQEAGVLPWMRERIPLLEIDGEIAELIGICRCEPAARDPLLSGLEISWDCPLPWRQFPQVDKSD
ncbi:tRNA lysidine(34) synthetase TilS [Sedimenticola hydrogenitrophicus]|uniref:tRNA lysidine(34) synthetase TilS n=1 Tax=Sedimenticola hydrogenitrophicus TaxID=2967975 RepID=UPI0021A81920|nr:tRNA lysidine(34) synthetase TilS [Sedimenticola hydrogenitrophicus]